MKDFGENLDFNDLEETISDPLEYSRRIAKKVDRTEEQIDDIEQSMSDEEAERRADDLVLEMRVESLENVEWKKENFTADAQDVTNGYLDLEEEIISSSMDVVEFEVAYAILQEGTEYTLSTVGGVTRVTFTSGITLGNLYLFKYQFNNN